MRAELRDSLEFLYADSQVGKRPCEAVSVDVARGGIASVHVLLNEVSEGQTLRIALRLKGRSVPEAQWFRLVHVPVEQNTGPVGFIEKEGEQNPHVARRAPFRVYDAMEPIRERCQITGATAALRLHVPVPLRVRPGTREYNVVIQAGRTHCEFAFTMRVHRPIILPAGRDSFPYTNWFSLDLMANRHGLKPWGDAHWRIIRRYAELMAHARQNTFLIPLGVVFSRERGEFVLDRARLRRIVKLFTDAGLHYIEGGHVAGRTDGEWGATTFDVTGTQVRATSVEGNALLSQIGRQLIEEMDRQRWHKRWIQHVTDEPTETNATDYRILVGMVRRHMSGLPILDATEDPEMAGSVDIWCPQAQEYQKHREQFEQARAAGDRVWFYTCCFPGGPWLNRLLDEELLRPALFGWGAALFDLQGFLHWGLNHYKSFQDPFEQSVVAHGGSNFLPPGDTHIVYPGQGEPWSSLRLEAQREGIEDYELLQQLKQRDPEQAQAIIRKVIRGFDQYTKKAQTLRNARRTVLQALT